LAIVLGGYALAQFTPPDVGYSSGESLGGISGTYSIYGTNGDGTGIVTNTLTFVDGILTAFP
jgi:hypothetical protein